MKHLLPLFSAVFFLSACTTVDFVRKDTVPVRQAVVRYLPPSNARNEAKYRDEVKKQAIQYCGGDFEITKEYQARGDSDKAVGVGTGVGFGMGGVFLGGGSGGSAMYNYVEFACKGK